MYRSIIVPLDGSRAAEHALPLAIIIARRAGATLQLVHIHDPARPMFMDAVPLLGDLYDAEHRERERAYLDNLAGRLMQRHKISITTTLLDGAPADTIALYALASCVDLVVMTTHGRSTQTHLWLGCVADELVGWAPTPLLLIRPQDAAPDLAHEPACHQMLIVLDGLASSEQHVAHAVALGTLLRAEYTLLHVIEPVRAADQTDPCLGTHQQALEPPRRRAQAYLARIAARLRAQALCVRTHVLVGEPAGAVLEYAHRHAIDVIVMQALAPSGVEQLLLGSVAERVLRGASVPVLLHHPRHVVEQAERYAGQKLSECERGLLSYVRSWS
jgi:nucleotide-binding universal stress UspA family protein